MKLEDLERLGDPDLRIACLRIWVHGRQFPASDDYWDGNWLRVTACVRSAGSWVWADGPILHLSEIAGLLEQGEQLHSTLSGEAKLACMEPNLHVEMVGDGRGRVRVEIAITPDQLAESHSYSDEIDQTHLPAILDGCRAILARYPVRKSGER